MLSTANNLAGTVIKEEEAKVSSATDSSSTAGGGFSFENYSRNTALIERGLAPPRITKTGTSIAAVQFDGGVVLGADTRSTSGSVVANKNCFKLHYLQPNIYALGAGTAADTEHVTHLISGRLELHRLNTGETPRVITAVRMLKQLLFQYQGHMEAYLIVGGVDDTGPHVTDVTAHGSSQVTPFLANGSGSLAILSVLEQQYKPTMNRQQAMDLVADAIFAGIHNDLGSGSNIDLCIIEKGKAKPDVLRPYKQFQPDVVKKEQSYTAPIRGKSTVFGKVVKPVEFDVLDIGITKPVPRSDDAMDTT